MRRLASLRFPLPKGWPACVKSALLDAVALGRMALLDVAADFENSPLPRARYAADISRMQQLLALRDEECRILRARMACIPATQRPQYPPAERLAILTARTAAGWNLAETGRRFLLTAKTISDWMRRIDEQGSEALVQLREPVNKYPDFMTVVVHQLHATVPAMGKVRIAQTLARASLKLSKTTVGRLLKRPLPKAQPPEKAKSVKAADANDSAKTAQSSKPEMATKPQAARTVTARYPHHVWHIDLSLLPIVTGFWTPWLPFTLPQCWPFCFWICVVLDHYSRSVVAWRLFLKQPTAQAVCRLLDDARDAAGRAPKYSVSDQGSQFQGEYRVWCDDNDVRPRFGAIGKSGSIAVLERFFRTLKTELLRRLVIVPLRITAMKTEVSAYMSWYNQHRPHQGLGGRTPAELRDNLVAAIDKPMMETRARFPLARGQPKCLASRVCGMLELVVKRVDGRAHLPVVSLLQAA